MEKKLDTKKQIIILTIVAVIMIILSLFISAKDKESKNEEKINKTSSNEVTIDGMNKQQLDNLKGLIDTNTYNQYKNYLENENLDKNEVIDHTTTAEDLLQSGESADFVTSDEQADLDKDLEEALRLYGYENNEP